MKGLKIEFLGDNELPKIKQTIGYLLHGKGDFVQRLYDCIYDSDLKLNGFGRNCVRDLYGWVNKEDVPIFNSRTIKCMRYFGFDVSL